MLLHTHAKCLHVISVMFELMPYVHAMVNCRGHGRMVSRPSVSMNIGQNIPWTKHPRCFLARVDKISHLYLPGWTLHPTYIYWGGQNIPARYDRVDKRSHFVFLDTGKGLIIVIFIVNIQFWYPFTNLAFRFGKMVDGT